jgi:hypothetical protein
LLDPALGWSVSTTSDINDGGQIVGQGTLNGQTHGFLMSPTDANQVISLTVTGLASPTTAGVPGSLTVTATNGFGTTVRGYTGTVHFASSDVQAVLPSDYTFTTADNGSHTFSATLKSAGAQSITAADTTAAGLSGAAGSTVNPAAASTLLVAGVPSSVTAGEVAFVTVTARDAYGNTATGYTGTISWSSSDPLSALPASYTFAAADHGVHSWFSVSLMRAGTQSITATDTVTASIAGSEAGIAVNPASASRLRITAPASVTAGAAFSVTITVLDAYGNVATGYTSKVHFKSSDGSATLPRDYTFTPADHGVHTFTGLILRKKGTQTITLTDTLIPSITDTASLTVV